MGETRFLTKKAFSYKGVFKIKEFCALIRRFSNEKGYFLIEKNNQEDVLPEGKQVVLETLLSKQLSDYAKGNIIVKVHMSGCEDKVVELDGHKHKCQNGSISTECIAKLESDYRGRWEGSGFLFFFRTLSDKFIRRDISHEQEEMVLKDCGDLASELKGYLNMHKFKLDQRENK